MPSVVAVTAVECQCLRRKAFWRALKHFPREKKQFIRLFQQRMREGVLSKPGETLTEDAAKEDPAERTKRTRGKSSEMPPRMPPKDWAQAMNAKKHAAERMRFRLVNPKALAQTWSAFSSREATSLERREAFQMSQSLGWEGQLRPHAVPKFSRVDRPRRGLTQDPLQSTSLLLPESRDFASSWFGQHSTSTTLSPSLAAWSRDPSADQGLSKLTLPSVSSNSAPGSRPRTVDAPGARRAPSSGRRPNTAPEPRKSRALQAKRAAEQLLRHVYVAACALPLPLGLVGPPPDPGSCAASCGSEEDPREDTRPSPRKAAAEARSPGDPYRATLKLVAPKSPRRRPPRGTSPPRRSMADGQLGSPQPSTELELAFRPLVPSPDAAPWTPAAAATSQWVPVQPSEPRGSRASRARFSQR